MKDMREILDSIEFIYQELERQKYAAGTIKIYRMIYNGLVKYMSSQEITDFDEKVCLDYLYFRTGCVKDGLYGKGNKKVNQVLKPLEVLMHYIDTGNVEYRMRAKLAPYCCPKQFVEEFNQLQNEFEERHYAPATIKCNIQKIKKFLIFLDSEGINTSEEIDASIITKFLRKYKGNKPKYVSTIIYVLRNYLTFLYVQGYTSKNKSVVLPKIRIMRNAFIPYTWKQEDVRKLLSFIDRGDAKGKRDYAIPLC